MFSIFTKAVRILNSIGEAVATGCEIFASFYFSINNNVGKYFAGGIVATLAAAGQWASTDKLEGPPIEDHWGEEDNFIYVLKSERQSRCCCRGARKPKPINETTPLQLESPVDNSANMQDVQSGLPAKFLHEHEDRCCACCTPTLRSVLTEMLYMSCDTLSEGANRYFLLILLNQVILNESLPNPAFWIIFVISLVCSTLFRATNATYYGSLAIAKTYPQKKAFVENRPFIGGILKNIGKDFPVTLKVIFVAGSVEHTLSHSIAVLLAVPKSPYMALKQQLPVLYYIALGISGVLGTGLVLLTFAQTWLFDAATSYKIVYGLTNKADFKKIELNIPHWFAKLLYYTMPSMAVVIGLEKGLAINTVGHELIPASTARSIIPPVSAAVVGLSRALGIFFSEVRESMNELATLVFRSPDSAAPTPTSNV